MTTVVPHDSLSRYGCPRHGRLDITTGPASASPRGTRDGVLPARREFLAAYADSAPGWVDALITRLATEVRATDQPIPNDDQTNRSTT